MLVSKQLHFGDIQLDVHDFENIGDELPAHMHGKTDTHISICARGSVQLKTPHWTKTLEAGNIIEFVPNQLHSITSLEPGTRVVNIPIYQNAFKLIGNDINWTAFIQKHLVIEAVDYVPEIKMYSSSGRDIERLILKVNPGVDVGVQYWPYAWPGGAALARYILDNPQYVKGLTVIDYGCGSGICGIAAALAGAKKVIAIDKSPLALVATELNAKVNSVNIETYLPGKIPEYDVIVAGDPGIALEAIRGMKNILVGSPARKSFDSSGFIELQSSVIPTKEIIEESTSILCKVYRSVI